MLQVTEQLQVLQPAKVSQGVCALITYHPVCVCARACARARQGITPIMLKLRGSTFL